MADRSTTPATTKARARQLAGIVLVALVSVFAVLNSQRVKMNWIVTTTHTPLIVVIAVFALLGVGIGFAASRHRGAAKRS